MLGFGPGSRNRKIGTIYQRVKGLVKSGALNSSEKPLWFDVWEAFPPAIAPAYDRPIPETEVKPILYPEDAVRVKFNKTFLTPLASIKHTNPLKVIKTQVFVNEYIRHQSPDKTVEEVIEATTKALQLRDIHFTRKDDKKDRLDDDTMLDDEFRMGKGKRWQDRKQAPISKSTPFHALDFSDVLGEGDTPPEESQSLSEKFKSRVTDQQRPKVDKRSNKEDLVKAKTAINSVEDVESVIDNLLDKPDSGQIRLDDFYGEANIDLDFVDEEEDESGGISDKSDLKKKVETSNEICVIDTINEEEDWYKGVHDIK